MRHLLTRLPSPRRLRYYSLPEDPSVLAVRNKANALDLSFLVRDREKIGKQTGQYRVSITVYIDVSLSSLHPVLTASARPQAHSNFL